MKQYFQSLAHKSAEMAGSIGAFSTAFLIILVWLLSGPLFHFSDTWQLVINTGTTIITFLMVFLIQNAQNRDSHAVHLKLDELIRAMDTANNDAIDLENCTDEELARKEQQFHGLREAARLEREGREQERLVELKSVELKTL